VLQEISKGGAVCKPFATDADCFQDTRVAELVRNVVGVKLKRDLLLVWLDAAHKMWLAGL
jgi:hypothetical protein